MGAASPREKAGTLSLSSIVCTSRTAAENTPERLPKSTSEDANKTEEEEEEEEEEAEEEDAEEKEEAAEEEEDAEDVEDAEEEEERRQRDSKVFVWKLQHPNIMCHPIRSESDRIGLVHDVC